MSVWVKIRIRVPGLLSLLIPYCSKLSQPLWFSPVSSHFHRCWFRQVPRCLPCCWFSPVSNLLHHPAPSQLCCPATSHLHIATGFAQLSSLNHCGWSHPNAILFLSLTSAVSLQPLSLSSGFTLLYGSTLGFPVISSILVCGSLSCTSSLQAPVSIGSTMVCQPSGSAELHCLQLSLKLPALGLCQAPPSLWLQHCPRSSLVCQAHISTSVMNTCSATLALQALRITLGLDLIDTVRLSAHLSLWFLISTNLFL